MTVKNVSLVRPDPTNPCLTERVSGTDQNGQPVETLVPVESPLALYLNSREIVTLMTVGDYPEYLAVGYLVNQNMLRPDDFVTGIDYDEMAEAVVVRTEQETDFEEKLAKQTRTSGCALGTVFGDIMETFEDKILDPDAKTHVMALRADCRNQHYPQPVSGSRCDPRLRALRTGPAADLHGGRGAAQRRR